jgi:glycosyltransferase involved in cell wall biosynthesis
MKITAILCNYNGGAFLRESIGSVLAQTRPADEFLVVDDGSTDDSREIIEELIADNPCARLIEHGTNQGQGAGFNTAIGEASGDWLCFIDSDDIWNPDKLQKVADAIPFGQASVLIQHPLQVIADGKITDRRVPEAMTFGDLWHIWNHHIYFPTFVPTTGLAIRADIAKKVLPVPTHLRHSADSFLTRATIAHGTVHAITEPLGLYRQHSGNAVLGNEAHDSWKFLLDQVAPHLHAYYLKLGKPSPIQKLIEKNEPLTLINRLMDISPRNVLRGLKRLICSKK